MSDLLTAAELKEIGDLADIIYSFALGQVGNDESVTVGELALAALALKFAGGMMEKTATEAEK